MVKTARLFVFLLFLVGDIAVASAENQEQSPSQPETITVVADTWCPYNCNPNSPHQGFMVDIAKKAFAKHNIKIVYKIVPWTQAIAETRKGVYTAIIGAAKNDAPDFIFPDKSQGFVENHFYVKKDNNWKYTGINSLKNVILGIIADYSYNDEIDDYIKQYKLDPDRISMMSGDEALSINISKLKRGKIGAVIEGNYVMNYYLSQNYMKDEVMNAGRLAPSGTDNLYIAFSPQNKKLSRKYTKILTDEMNNMHKNGELKQIMDTYGLEIWDSLSDNSSEK